LLTLRPLFRHFHFIFAASIFSHCHYIISSFHAIIFAYGSRLSLLSRHFDAGFILYFDISPRRHSTFSAAFHDYAIDAIDAAAIF